MGNDVSKGSEFRKASQYDKAHLALDGVLVQNPQNARALNEKGNVYATEGKWHNAWLFYTLAREQDPTEGAYWANEGRSLRYLRRYEHAHDAYDQALVLDPNDAFTLNAKGRVYKAEGKWDDALSYYKKARVAAPAEKGYWADEAYALGQLGRYDEAHRILNQALVLDPQFTRALEIKEELKKLRDEELSEMEKQLLLENGKLDQEEQSLCEMETNLEIAQIMDSQQEGLPNPNDNNAQALVYEAIEQDEKSTKSDSNYLGGTLGFFRNKSSKNNIFNNNNIVPKMDGLTYQPVPGDGHCLFHAVALYCEQEQSVLRNIVAAHIEHNLETFHNFIELANGQTVQAYLQAVKQGEQWAGHVEIEVLMRVLDRPIIVIMPDRSIRNPEDGQRFTGEPIFVYYNDHNHYDVYLLNDDYKHRGRELLSHLLLQQPVTQFDEDSPQQFQQTSANTFCQSAPVIEHAPLFLDTVRVNSLQLLPSIRKLMEIYVQTSKTEEEVQERICQLEREIAQLKKAKENKAELNLELELVAQVRDSIVPPPPPGEVDLRIPINAKDIEKINQNRLSAALREIRLKPISKEGTPQRDLENTIQQGGNLRDFISKALDERFAQIRRDKDDNSNDSEASWSEPDDDNSNEASKLNVKNR